jgi:small subunit ribosomal protein S10e
MVLISKVDKRKVYEYLLNEGVIVVKKDMHLNHHTETGVPNLHVWMLLRSLKDKGLVTLTFNWQYYYYCITTEGLPFLREKLGFTDESIVPITF